ncbi:MAG: hypothetical protein CVV44_12160 [Spirochaetae bacterium HGW-Spirochaetae-1]|jgi:hypothetical protein|nr:MAG: hypothetical protein CVV44_12160 [Spirochaetae bacterium HGW-Spirochaetae-1]
MFKAPEMRAADYTCLLCGSRLELKLENLVVGDNTGSCPMCAEPFCIIITTEEMYQLIKIERQSGTFVEQ